MEPKRSRRLVLAAIPTIATAAPLALIFGARASRRSVVAPAGEAPESRAAPISSATAAEASPSPTPAERKAVAEATDLVPQISKRLGRGFRIVRTGFYIVAGDLSAAELDRYRRRTVEACDRALEASLFPQRPARALVVYLFRDARSYEANVKRLCGYEPSTPYGFYVESERSLYMNIGTGGGTLVHEMTHALMDSDCPDAPCWIFEGIGSLYEQCSVAENRLYGRVNWRLPGLQEGIREGRLVPLRRLVQRSYDDFADGEESGMLYAESRYLMQYLQERKLLLRFWREFKANKARDPTGARTLAKVTGRSLDQLQREWLKWVKTLRWRR